MMMGHTLTRAVLRMGTLQLIRSLLLLICLAAICVYVFASSEAALQSIKSEVTIIESKLPRNEPPTDFEPLSGAPPGTINEVVPLVTASVAGLSFLATTIFSFY